MEYTLGFSAGTAATSVVVGALSKTHYAWKAVFAATLLNYWFQTLPARYTWKYALGAFTVPTAFHMLSGDDEESAGFTLITFGVLALLVSGKHAHK